MDTMKEFVAYAKLLLRRLIQLKALLDSGNIEAAKVLLDEMIEDAQGDIQA